MVDLSNFKSKKDCEEIVKNLRELQDYMLEAYDNANEENWSEFLMENPITIGFGSHVLLLPNFAQGYSDLRNFIKNAIDDWDF